MSKQSEEWYIAEIQKRDLHIAALSRENSRLIDAFHQLRGAALRIERIAAEMEVTA